jgi:hypothetical protein
MAKRKPRQLPKVGTVYEKRFKKTLYRLTVVKTGHVIGFKVGTNVYQSPSGAAKAITGSEVNGWAFWGMEAERSSVKAKRASQMSDSRKGS